MKTKLELLSLRVTIWQHLHQKLYQLQHHLLNHGSQLWPWSVRSATCCTSEKNGCNKPICTAKSYKMRYTKQRGPQECHPLCILSFVRWYLGGRRTVAVTALPVDFFSTGRCFQSTESWQLHKISWKQTKNFI